jgi:hypothetical protein
MRQRLGMRSQKTNASYYRGSYKWNDHGCYAPYFSFLWLSRRLQNVSLRTWEAKNGQVIESSLTLTDVDEQNSSDLFIFYVEFIRTPDFNSCSP